MKSLLILFIFATSPGLTGCAHHTNAQSNLKAVQVFPQNSGANYVFVDKK